VTRPFMESIDTLEHLIVIDAPKSQEMSYQGLMERHADASVDSIQPDPEDIAGFIYTSGTTGRPKGVLLSHGNFTSNINAVQELFPMRDNDRSLSFLPWAHSFGQTCELHCMIASGAAIGIAESVQTIIQNLPEVRPTLLFAVPRIFNKIYDGLQKRFDKEGGIKKVLFETAMANANRRREMSRKGQTSWWVESKHKVFDSLVFSKVRERFGGRLEYAFSGGAALDPEVAMFIDNLEIIIYEGYGLSETSPICTANYPDNRKIGSVGKPIPGVEVMIEPVEHIKDKGVGEIVVKGPNVMKGYYNLPEETERAFTESGAFRTGDLGRIDSDGYVHIVGRVKEQYKLENGKYVVPAPLEEKLQLSPYVNQCMIDGANKLYNIALIVPDIPALQEWAQEQGKSTQLDVLLNDPDVHKLYTSELAERGTSFKGYERPRKFRLIKEEFSVENDMLTPKMSLKRRNVLKAYGDLIDAMYDEG
ncbi:MAG: long-chain fatty acid--CoA ligase, partial [Myxococcota bacterium]